MTTFEPEARMIFAIDTSTEQASLALQEGTRLRAEWSWRAGRNHSRHLARTIEGIWEIEGVRPSDLTTIVVAKGPGSFSGVRVGISHAKGLAMALSTPLVGISTLDVIGFQASFFASSVWAAIPAGRGQLYLAQYSGDSDSFARLSDYSTVSIDQARTLIGEADVAGPGTELLGLRAGNPWLSLRRAGFLAELGRRYITSGGHDQLDSLEPLYLRQSAAEEKRAASTGS